MKRVVWSMLVLAAISAAGIGGYRAGRPGFAVPSMTAAAADRASGSGSVIYYQDPDGKPFYSAEPKSTPDGRPYRAVHSNEDIGFDGGGTVKADAAAAASADRKIL